MDAKQVQRWGDEQTANGMYSYLDERKRALGWIAYHETQYRKGSKERQLLDMLYKQLEGGKDAPQGRLGI